jgi:CheY-like chemotaxis protein
MSRILIVDDEKMQLVLRAALLEACGYKVVAVQNGVEAVAVFKQQSFDLVITDWLMPNMTGLDVARELKNYNPDVPIIMLTGWDKLLDVSDPRRRDVDMVLPKPCDAEMLLKVVGESMGKIPNSETLTFV